jgi:catechol 2,3-dioxygenase-like lactoylglutathione lyase family enzyme
MPLDSIDHVTINTAQPDATVEFYTNLLGMYEGARPPLGFPGKWLYVGERPVLHLVFVDNQTKAETGDFDHVAFLGSDYDGIRAKLVERRIEFRENIVAGGTTRQLFFPDPNNVKVEINFPPHLQK